MKVETKFAVSGIFTGLEVLDRHGNIKKSHGGFKNLILDTGLERIASNELTLFSFCRVGTGTAAPLPTDTALVNQIGQTQADLAVQPAADRGVNLAEGFAWVRVTYTFPLGGVVGNISEIGTGWAATGVNTLFSRALIRDSEGNPTSITLLSDEQLRVVWEHRRYWPTEDSSGVVENTGNKGGSFSWTARALDVSSWAAGISGPGTGAGATLSAAFTGSSACAWLTGPANLVPINQPRTGTAVASGDALNLPYVPGSHRKGIRFRFPLAVGNETTGIGGFLVTWSVSASASWSRVGYQIQITPGIFKTANDILQVDFYVSWARA